MKDNNGKTASAAFLGMAEAAEEAFGELTAYQRRPRADRMPAPGEHCADCSYFWAMPLRCGVRGPAWERDEFDGACLALYDKSRCPDDVMLAALDEGAESCPLFAARW